MAKRTSRKSQAKRAQPPDAVQMLKTDHKQVRKWFEQFYAGSDDDKGSIARRLFIELDIHSKLEEELFYPAVQSKLESLGKMGDDFAAAENGEDINDEQVEANVDEINGTELEVVGDKETASEVISAAYESHRTVDDLIQQLRSLDPNSEDYGQLFTELEEAIIEHVAEEEDVIFPLAAAHLDVQALGMKMQQRKDDLSSQSPLAA